MSQGCLLGILTKRSIGHRGVRRCGESHLVNEKIHKIIFTKIFYRQHLIQKKIFYSGRICFLKFPKLTLASSYKPLTSRLNAIF